MQSTAVCGAAATPGQEYICDICTLSYNKDQLDGLACGHMFCKHCWNQYLKTMIIDEGRAQVIQSLVAIIIILLLFYF